MKWSLFLLPSLLFGAYVGNPANPAIMNAGFFSAQYPFIKGTSGYVYDYTSNKRMEAKQTRADFDPNSTFKEFGLHSQLASFSVILVERMEIFGYVGNSKEQAKGHVSSTTPFDFESKHHFSWGSGIKAVLIQWGKTYLSSDFTYFTIPSSTKSFFQFFDKFHLPFDFSKQTFYLREWQVSGALSSRFYCFTPYGGVTYLHSRLHIHSGPDTGSIDYFNREKIGYFYGITLSLTGKFHLNFERRVRDEFAYTFSTIAVF
jgi:hypothetical protein